MAVVAAERLVSREPFRRAYRGHVPSWKVLSIRLLLLEGLCAESTAVMGTPEGSFHYPPDLQAPWRHSVQHLKHLMLS